MEESNPTTEQYTQEQLCNYNQRTDSPVQDTVASTAIKYQLLPIQLNELLQPGGDLKVYEIGPTDAETQAQISVADLKETFLAINVNSRRIYYLLADMKRVETRIEQLEAKNNESDTGGEKISADLAVTKYGALRDEIHQRMDLRQQLLTYTLVGAASFFSLGLQSWTSAITLLCYPALAFFLACAWGQHDTRIGQIAVFLRDLEDRLLGKYGPGWETYRRTTFKKEHRFADFISLPARGLFAGSELLALILGLARFWVDPQMIPVFILLVVIDCLAVLATIFVLTHRRVRSEDDHEKVKATGVL